MGWEDRSYYRESRGSRYGWLSWLFSGTALLYTAFGIRVRVHAGLIVLAALAIIFGIGIDGFTWQDRVVACGALFLAVLLHEYGHCFAARWVGGYADDILLWPLGGLAFAQPPRRPLPTFITVAAGPLVNLLICLVAAGFLALIGVGISFNPVHFGRLSALTAHPLYSSSTVLYAVGKFVALLFFISGVLFAFNVIWPVFPLDGGQMLQAILWKPMGYLRSMRTACIVGLGGSVVMALTGLYGGGLLMPCIAISCFFYCFQMLKQLKYADPGEYETVGAGVDYSASLYAKDPKPKRKAGSWFARQAKAVQEQRVEQEKVDAILAKVSAQGMASLSSRERKTLARATEEQRKRDLEFQRRTRL